MRGRGGNPPSSTCQGKDWRWRNIDLLHKRPLFPSFIKAATTERQAAGQAICGPNICTSGCCGRVRSGDWKSLREGEDEGGREGELRGLQKPRKFCDLNQRKHYQKRLRMATAVEGGSCSRAMREDDSHELVCVICSKVCFLKCARGLYRGTLARKRSSKSLCISLLVCV